MAVPGDPSLVRRVNPAFVAYCTHAQSKEGKVMKKEDLLKVLKGAGIAAAGAVLTYLSQWISGADFGAYTPMVVALWGILVNFLRKLLAPSAVTMAVAFTLATLTASPAFAADPKPVCICGDACKCKKGDCPGKCPLAAIRANEPKPTVKAYPDPKPNRDLEAANAAVAKGQKAVLCLGVPAIDGAYCCGPIDGYANGVYDCSRENGANVMRIRQTAASGTYCVGGVRYSGSAPAVTYSVGNPLTGSCANGQCQGTTTRRR